MSTTNTTSYSQFFAAVLLLAAANSWSTVFNQLYASYAARKKGNSAIFASVVFASLLTVVSIDVARRIYASSSH